jgi:hypothetical protein
VPGPVKSFAHVWVASIDFDHAPQFIKRSIWSAASLTVEGEFEQRAFTPGSQDSHGTGIVTMSIRKIGSRFLHTAFEQRSVSMAPPLAHGTTPGPTDGASARPLITSGARWTRGAQEGIPQRPYSGACSEGHTPPLEFYNRMPPI